MFKCKSCKREYESEECFSLSSDDDETVFDGEAMRDTCPACGGMLYPVEEALLVESAA